MQLYSFFIIKRESLQKDFPLKAYLLISIFNAIKTIWKSMNIDSECLVSEMLEQECVECGTLKVHHISGDKIMELSSQKLSPSGPTNHIACLYSLYNICHLADYP